ncbi:N-formylglutamate amidohydrolase [Cupriavidus neocaledonicus]|uniref:N-formylglutamate amidohydrolase n=1 Tax=Cupriavidus neocaledonicus TaxID=1040979 RepID=A0A375H8V7_9BURK|nr:N-formylglutamate amidohydrolase [Cupriavidus neocaledonicus]SOZ36551.1 putative N-formylglutamate amidohydrolase [Cupriavidus neocaledonicus]SPD48534.1 N-formylglutamate amidohydrolase [Cupriavidus neocaledonicus]
MTEASNQAAALPPVIVCPPQGQALPLVCDSPHSGTVYPADFGAAVSAARLRGGEDTHVDALWQAVPAAGGTLIAATFPRVYIDPNRMVDDIDPAQVDGTWPTPLAPGPKTQLGYGLIWSRIDAATPIYDRRLSVAEVQARIARYYRPYHAALAEAVEGAYARFGALWHLNLHSMPNNAYERLKIASPHPLADFVLGDRDGTTCEPGVVDLVERELRGMGYTVARNDPYKGVQLIAQIGRPAERRNSLQIEIRRPLYMDEVTRERNAGFAVLQRDLGKLTEQVAAYIRSQL